MMQREKFYNFLCKKYCYQVYFVFTKVNNFVQSTEGDGDSCTSSWKNCIGSRAIFLKLMMAKERNRVKLTYTTRQMSPPPVIKSRYRLDLDAIGVH